MGSIKFDYRVFYEDLIQEINNLLVENRDEGIMLNELVNRVKKKQEREVFND